MAEMQSYARRRAVHHIHVAVDVTRSVG